MAKAFKDFHGEAAARFEKTLKTEDAKERNTVAIETLSLAEQEKIILEREFEFQQLQRSRSAERREISDQRNYISMAAQFATKTETSDEKRERIRLEREAARLERPTRTRTPRVEAIAKEVQILSATYGLADIRVIDITEKIVVGAKVTNEIAGEDPCPKKKKEVVVKALVDGVEVEVTFTEGKKIVF